MPAPIQRVGDEHSETEGASAKIKKVLTSFQKPQSPVIYVVEEHERAAALTEAAPYIFQMRIRNDPMERQIQKRGSPSCPHLFRKGKNQYKLKNCRETQDSRKNPYRAEMTGRKQGNPCVSEIPSPAVPRGNFNPTLLGKFFPPLTSHIYK